MSSKLRQNEILEILEKQGYVTVKYLTEVLHYSTATINRDLNALQNQQLVTRSHGGVELVRAKYIPVFFRTHKMQTEKRYIGKAAASFVEDGDTIFIDGSTTAQCMGQYLTNRKDLTVITNNIILAATLSEYDIAVICLGGTIVELPSMLYGPETIENAGRYKVDKMFFSTIAASSNGIIASGPHYSLMHKAIANNAGEIFYLVDHKKIDLPFNTIYSDFNQIDYVISDYDFSEETKEKYNETQFVVI